MKSNTVAKFVLSAALIVTASSAQAGPWEYVQSFWKKVTMNDFLQSQPNTTAQDLAGDQRDKELKAQIRVFERQAAQASGKSVSCYGISLEQCLVGIKKLDEVTGAENFKGKRFTHIDIEDDFEMESNGRRAIVDFNSTTKKIKAHLVKQIESDIEEEATLAAQQVEKRKYKREASNATDKSVSCYGLSHYNCVTGLKKIIKIAGSLDVKGKRFTHIDVEDDFNMESNDRRAIVDYKANIKDIKKHLSHQIAIDPTEEQTLKANRAEIRKLEREASQISGKSVNCYGLSHEQCVTGLIKLVEVVKVIDLSNKRFSNIDMEDRFTTENNSRRVILDYTAESGVIKEQLELRLY